MPPGECGRSEAMDGWRDGPRTEPREPRRSSLCLSLSCFSSDAFISRGLGVLKMVRLSLHRALQSATKSKINNFKKCFMFFWGDYWRPAKVNKALKKMN